MTSEFESLEKKLLDNVHNQKRDISIFPDIEQFLRKYPDPKIIPEANFPLIKEITKAAQYCRNVGFMARAGANFDARIWETALAYSLEGAKRIEENKCSIETTAKLEVCGNFYNYAGDYAFQIAQMIPEFQIKRGKLQESINNYTKGIDILEKANVKEVAYTYGFRGTAIREFANLHGRGERITYILAAAKDTIKGGELSRTLNAKHSAYQYSIGGKYKFHAAKAAFHVLAPEFQTEKLFEAIEHEKTALEIHPNDKFFRSEVDCDMGKMYDMIFQITRKKEYAGLAIKHYELAMPWLREGHRVKLEAQRRTEQLKMVFA